MYDFLKKNLNIFNNYIFYCFLFSITSSSIISISNFDFLFLCHLLLVATIMVFPNKFGFIVLIFFTIFEFLNYDYLNIQLPITFNKIS